MRALVQSPAGAMSMLWLLPPSSRRGGDTTAKGCHWPGQKVDSRPQVPAGAWPRKPERTRQAGRPGRPSTVAVAVRLRTNSLHARGLVQGRGSVGLGAARLTASALGMGSSNPLSAAPAGRCSPPKPCSLPSSQYCVQAASASSQRKQPVQAASASSQAVHGCRAHQGCHTSTESATAAHVLTPQYIT